MLGSSGYPRKDLECYFSEPWMTQWLVKWELGPPVPGEVLWEPAAGLGGISKVLESHGYDVMTTDIHDHGGVRLDGVMDFLATEPSYLLPMVRAIITNPPFDIHDVAGAIDCTAEDFVRHAIKLMKPVGGAVYMLLRHEWECASSRRDLFPSEGGPFKAKHSFVRRPLWVDPDPKTKKQKASPRFNFAWFVWDWSYTGQAQFHLLPKDEP